MLNERSEILFVYQVKDANPNGDPLEDNKPRTDPETGVATVTDVRIKRWIRDYWRDRLNKPIWIIEDWKEDGTLKEAFERLDELMKKESITADELHKLADMKVPLVRIRGKWAVLSPQDIEKTLKFVMEHDRKKKIPLSEVIRDEFKAIASGIAVSGLEGEGPMKPFRSRKGNRSCSFLS